MDGRTFLGVARRLAQGGAEADWRTAAGRAYYALLLEGRAALQRWGFSILRQDQIHAFVRLRFLYAADADLKDIGRVLEELVLLRNRADYQLDRPGPFVSVHVVTQAVLKSQDAINRLDRIDHAPARRAAVIADIQARWP